MDPADVGRVRWIENDYGVLIRGLDGGEYEAYAPSTVRRVQEALAAAGYYQGEAHGHLDVPTMEATAEFQREEGIHASGVPSPLTRDALFDDSAASNNS